MVSKKYFRKMFSARGESMSMIRLKGRPSDRYLTRFLDNPESAGE